MSARAYVLFDQVRLCEILCIDGVPGKSTVEIDIEDDTLLDSLVEALTQERLDRRLRGARRKVQHLEAQRMDAIAVRRRRHADWKAADDHERAVHHELHVAQQELKALEGDVS